MSATSDFEEYDIPDEIVLEAFSPFKKLKPEEREQLLQIVAARFNIEARAAHGNRHQVNAVRYESEQASSFSEDRRAVLSPKEFIMQKQPRTDVERIACLAYYLTHYRETPHFKTLDLSKLNTDAAQPKFANAANAVENATKSNYLVSATKGNKQISAPGEQFVEALPDKDAARAAMNTVRPKRKARKQSQRNRSED